MTTVYSIIDFTQLIESKHCPANLTLNLEYNNIGPAGAKDIANALASGLCPAGLTLNIAWNNIGSAGAKDIVDALLNTPALKGLRLIFDTSIQDNLKQTLSQKAESILTNLNALLENNLRAQDAGILAQTLFAALLKHYEILETLGENVKKQQANLYAIYFNNQLSYFSELSSEQCDTLTLQRLDDLYNDFKQLSSILKHDDKGAFTILYGFTMAFSALAESPNYGRDAVLHLLANKHHCFWRLSKDLGYENIVQKDKEKLNDNSYKAIGRVLNAEMSEWNPGTQLGIYFSNRNGMLSQHKFDHQAKRWGEMHTWRLYSKAGDKQYAADDCLSEKIYSESPNKMAPF